MGNKFEAGVEFKNMEGFRFDSSSSSEMMMMNVFDEGLASSSMLIDGMGNGL